MANLHVSISAETLFYIGPFPVTNSMITSLIAGLILIGVSLWSARIVKQTRRPKGWQNFLEFFIESLEGLTISITESPKKTKTIFPYVLSFFLFILLNNWLGLVPGVGTIGFIENPESSHEEQSQEAAHEPAEPAEAHTEPASDSTHGTEATPAPHEESSLKPNKVFSFGLVKLAYAAEPATLAQTSTLPPTPATRPEPSLLETATPTIILSLLVLISIVVSRSTTAVQTPKGLQNAVEALVETAKNIVNQINRSKFLKTSLTIVLGIVILVDVLVWTGLWSRITTRQPSAPEPTVVTAPPATALPQPVTPPPAPAEEEHGPVFVPYLRAGTADLNTTLALAIVSVVATQIVGVQYLGTGFFKKYINFKSPIDAFVGILEIISEIGHIISFSFRLFGNVIAGEVLLAVMYFLLPLIVPLPFLGLEIFVGAIQAFVFATLTLVFMNMATQGHGEEHEDVYA